MRRTGIACAVIAVVCAVSAGSGADAADVSQPIAVPTTPGCSPGYSWQRMPVRYQCATPQPTCAYGFASGPSWNGSAWVYSCNAPPPPPPPPPPTCPSGTNQAAAPSWNGAAWVGQVCQPAAPTTGNPVDLSAICYAAATKQLGPIPPWQPLSTTRTATQTSFQTDEYMGGRPTLYWEIDECTINNDGTNPTVIYWGHGNDMGG